jgi:hypothetical protein
MNNILNELRMNIYIIHYLLFSNNNIRYKIQ